MAKTIEVPEVLLEELRTVARGKRVVFYKQVAERIDIDTSNWRFASQLGPLLDQVNRDEFVNNRPLLSAVVVGKVSGCPGIGFFKCAEELLGVSITDYPKYWSEELQRVYDYWSEH
jgi:hypothetical protein